MSKRNFYSYIHKYINTEKKRRANENSQTDSWENLFAFGPRCKNSAICAYIIQKWHRMRRDALRPARPLAKARNSVTDFHLFVWIRLEETLSLQKKAFCIEKNIFHIHISTLGTFSSIDYICLGLKNFQSLFLCFYFFTHIFLLLRLCHMTFNDIKYNFEN